MVSPARAYIPAYVQDQRFDATQADRTEMSRKTRDFDRNLWLVGAIKREFTKWTVGPNGLQVIPETSDDEWDAAMQDAYLEWCERPCIDSTISMAQVHKQIAGEFCVEGGLFWLETYRKASGRPSEPALQLIRGHNVGSPAPDWTSRESQGVVDGVQLAIEPATGRPTSPEGYWVRDASDSNGWTFRSAFEMHQIFDPDIPGSFREISPFHAVIDTLQDVKELEAMEMQRAKSNAEEAKIFTTLSGEIPDAVRIRNAYNKSAGLTNTAAKEEDLEKRLVYYRHILGSRAIALRPGEDVKTPTNNSPSAATQWLWRYKLGQVCAARGVPLVLIFPELIESIQGTLVRGIYDSAHEYFRGQTFLFAMAARRMYVMFADWARRNDPRLFNYPDDWWKCRIIPPRAVNVDVGYTSEARIAELNAGLTDYDTEAASHGTTAEIIARRKARNISMLKKVAAEESERSGYEVRPEEIAGNLATILQALAAAKAAGSSRPNPAEETDPEVEPEEDPEEIEA